MFDSQETNETTRPYRERGEPAPPPVTRRQRGGCYRRGAITALILLLLVVFGVGMFAGWEVGRGNAAAPVPNTGLLQPGKSTTVTVRALTGTTLETVREAVVVRR